MPNPTPIVLSHRVATERAGAGLVRLHNREFNVTVAFPDSGSDTARVACPECGESLPITVLTAEAESQRLRRVNRGIRIAAAAAVAGALLGVLLLNLDMVGLGMALLFVGGGLSLGLVPASFAHARGTAAARVDVPLLQRERVAKLGRKAANAMPAHSVVKLGWNAPPEPNRYTGE